MKFHDCIAMATTTSTAALLLSGLLALPAATQAYQPVEAGLQPLLERVKAIEAEQAGLNTVLKTPLAAKPTQTQQREGAEARDPADSQVLAQAWKRHQALEAERLKLKTEIELTRLRGQSPLIMFAGPAGSAAGK